jgi:hypothetical protein
MSQISTHLLTYLNVYLSALRIVVQPYIMFRICLFISVRKKWENVLGEIWVLVSAKLEFCSVVLRKKKGTKGLAQNLHTCNLHLPCN